VSVSPAQLRCPALSPAGAITRPLSAAGITTVGVVLQRTPQSLYVDVLGKTQAAAVSDLVQKAEAKVGRHRGVVVDALKRTASTRTLISTDDLSSPEARQALAQLIAQLLAASATHRRGERCGGSLMIENTVGRSNSGFWPKRARQDPSRLLVERFTRAVLEDLCQRLEARFPRSAHSDSPTSPALVAIGTGDERSCEVSRSAVDLADSIQPSRASPMEGILEAPAVIFEDEATWLASYLRSTSTRSGAAWYHAAWRKPGLGERLGSPAGRKNGCRSFVAPG